MILVIGGTGTIGSQLVKLLSANGVSFRVLSRDPKKVKGAEAVRGDLGEPASLDVAFRGVESFFLLTNSTPESVKWKENAIAAARKASARRVVHLSVIGAGLDSSLQISRWHAQTEVALRESGLSWTNLQPGYFMQNTLQSAAAIKNGLFYAAAGEGRIAGIDARDIAAAAFETLTGEGHDKKSYPLTGPEALSFEQMMDKLSVAVGRQVNYVNLAPADLRKSLLSAGMPDWMVADFVTLHASFAEGGAAKVDPTLEKLIGRRRTFDDFARDYATEFA